MNLWVLFAGVLLGLVVQSLHSAPAEIVVASYNVQSYVAEPDSSAGGRAAKPKSEEAVEALIQVIKEINPDILGICEMGGPEQFEDFKARLKQAGLEYSDAEYLQAEDADRHLALLSRFPIVSRQSLADVGYELSGRPEKVMRGFLDVTIRVNPDYDLRLVGAHLKSKLAAPQGEALMRRYEAQLLRKHLETILSGDPHVNLLAYGDFNDSKSEPAIREIMGVRGRATYMTDLPAADEFGDRWTHYWPAADQYSRFDYFFVSPALLPEVIKERSRVHRSPATNVASDHRAIYTSIIPVNRKR